MAQLMHWLLRLARISKHNNMRIPEGLCLGDLMRMHWIGAHVWVNDHLPYRTDMPSLF